MAGRPTNENREMAILMGDKTYTGSTHARCGTDLRYVKGGGCVHCARQVTQDLRDTAKWIKHEAADRAEHVENTGLTREEAEVNGFDADVAEDTSVGDELDKLPTDEYEQAIDSLM